MRWFETSLHLALLPAVVLAAACSERTPPAERLPPARNVLLITIDTLRADRLGAYGHPRPTSPRIDELARSAVVFDRAQSTSSWTLPAMASLLTSLYPSAHGCHNFETVLSPSYTTLGERLAGEGFATAGFTSHEIVSGRFGLDQGFQTFDTFSVYEDLPPGVTDPKDAPANVTTADWVSDRGIEWLESAAGSADRWLLWLHYFDPHTAYVPHPGLTERFLPATGKSVEEPYYEGEILFTDQHVGRVLDAVSHLGAFDDTLIIVVADHGEELLDHGKLGHKQSLYREVTRIPLIIRAPSAAPRRVDTTVSLVDLLPTVLDCAGLEAPEIGMGRSLKPFLLGESLPPRAALLELEMDRPGHRLQGLVTDRYKLVRAVESGQLSLFDLERDPTEREDLAGRNPERDAALSGTLDRLLQAGARAAAAFDPAVVQPLNEAELERLRALGYLGGDGGGTRSR